MLLKEYLIQLKRLAKKNPEFLNLPVYYSIDDEGNDFKPIFYGPSVMDYKNKKTLCLN